MFAAFSFFQGNSLGSLIEVLLFVDASIVVTALAATTGIFLCFSASALFGTCCARCLPRPAVLQAGRGGAEFCFVRVS